MELSLRGGSPGNAMKWINGADRVRYISGSIYIYIGAFDCLCREDCKTVFNILK